MTINLQDAGAGCDPQVGAYVDIWHANAQGAYSDVSGSGNPDNVGVDWLRGDQVSDDNGAVTFTTVMPGYYTSRTIHIHFRVRLTLADDSEVNFTSQFFFDESVNAGASVSDTLGSARTECALIRDVHGPVEMRALRISGIGGAFFASNRGSFWTSGRKPLWQAI